MKKIMNPIMLVGIIFAPIGGLFLILGLAISGSLFFKGGYVTVNGVYTYYAPGEFNMAVGLFLGLFGGMGLLFLILGLIFLGIGIKRNNAVKRVLETGKQITARITGVELNYSVRINRRHPYIIICEYEDAFSGKIHVFKSDSILHNPGDVVGESVTVLVDRDNWDTYYVDTDSFTSKYEYH